MGGDREIIQAARLLRDGQQRLRPVADRGWNGTVGAGNCLTDDIWRFPEIGVPPFQETPIYL